MIGTKLTAIRKDLDMNQKQIEVKIGIKQDKLSKVEGNVETVVPLQLLQFYYDKGYNLNWVFGDEPNMKRLTDSTIVDLKEKIHQAMMDGESICNRCKDEHKKNLKALYSEVDK